MLCFTWKAWCVSHILPSTDVTTRTSMPLLQPPSGRHFPAPRASRARGRVATMPYSYTQIAQYLRCPRSYRHRYLDGWREKETRAALVFGRCFEKALDAYFCGDDCS